MGRSRPENLAKAIDDIALEEESVGRFALRILDYLDGVPCAWKYGWATGPCQKLKDYVSDKVAEAVKDIADSKWREMKWQYRFHRPVLDRLYEKVVDWMQKLVEADYETGLQRILDMRHWSTREAWEHLKPIVWQETRSFATFRVFWSRFRRVLEAEGILE